MEPQNAHADTDDRQRARLLWQCRRGMLELDAMLQSFMDRRYDDLSPAGRQAFEMLLRAPDQLLLDYLMGHTVPVDPEVADVARQIRRAAGP